MAIIHLKDDAKTSFRTGCDALDNGDFPRAIAELSYAAQIDPERAAYWEELAKAYGEGGALKESTRIYLMLMSRAPALSHVQEIGRNLMADGKNREADDFVHSAMYGVRELSVDAERLGEYIRYQALGFAETEEAAADYDEEEPPLFTAKDIHEEALYRVILDAEAAGNYPEMMRLALTFPPKANGYPEILELITHHMHYTFRDEDGAQYYAKKLKDLCPESAVHFDVLYPFVPSEEKEGYLQETVSNIMEYGYPEDMELLVKVLIGQQEYDVAKRCNERFLQEIPYRESLWIYRVCLAYLNGEDGEDMLKKCRRAFPFAPFVFHLQWAASYNDPMWWQDVARGLPVGVLEMEEEVTRFATGQGALNRYATTKERAFQLIDAALRYQRITNLPECADEVWRNDEDYHAFLRRELADPEIDERHKERILYRLLDFMATGVVTVTAYGRVCRSNLKALPNTIWRHLSLGEVYRRLTVNLFMEAEKVNSLYVARAVRNIDELPSLVGRRMSLLTAVAHYMYFGFTEVHGISIEDLAMLYGVKAQSLERFLAQFAEK